MIAVEAKEISKYYKLYKSPTDRIKEIILRKSYHNVFNTLENINFSIFKGETLGIIGENGAGKSTLLKILAKTLKPSSGELIINGRVAALLELGAGFNPELTGYENIYLNAYLLGLNKDEVDYKRDEIIEFSELSDFINRPVKTYSSGMYVRLAFSIATSVDPDVLIIDEALSVGDEHFQKKCIDRMMNFKNAGKTILFCSHSMYHVQELCSRAMWLHNGKINFLGDTSKVINQYKNYERERSASAKTTTKQLESSDKKCVEIIDLKINGIPHENFDSIKTFQPMEVTFSIICEKELKGHVGFGIMRNDEEVVFATMSHFDGAELIELYNNKKFCLQIEELPILDGMYSLIVAIGDNFALHPYDYIRTSNFQIISGTKYLGIAHIPFKWKLT